jgi:hypothetical protein
LRRRPDNPRLANDDPIGNIADQMMVRRPITL